MNFSWITPPCPHRSVPLKPFHWSLLFVSLALSRIVVSPGSAASHFARRTVRSKATTGSACRWPAWRDKKNAGHGQSAATTEARAQAPQHEETCWRALRAEHIIDSARDRSKAGIALVALWHKYAADPMLQRGSWISLSSSLVALTPIEKLDRLRYPGWSAHFLEVHFVQEEATTQDLAHR